MNFDHSISQDLSIRSEYDTDFSEKSTKLMLAFQDSLSSGDPAQVYKIAEIAEQIKDLQLVISEDLEVLKLYCAHSVSTLTEISIKNGLPKDIGESIKKNCFYKIARSHNKGELADININAFEELLASIKKYSMKQYSLVIKMALEFIHNNKFKFLYAKDVAEAISVNRSYLSKRFREEVGETLTDYIHKTKLEFAIQLMRSNVYHFNEIAELLGYQNYSYFSRVFKKYYALSPVEYIKK
ncbi:MAG TPA: helix-turn-helix transcriptional regulator [Clostridiales bacterium]|nr:helix-turn-helix transcriptional regulator [Clostridiales bacterium]